MTVLTSEQLEIINSAIAILNSLFKKKDLFAISPEHVKQFCQLQAGHFEHEVFGVLLLDNKHQLIETVILFRGTINNAPIYPREVAKEVLKHNAAACIFFHNHPSGALEPSESDRRITKTLIDGLNLIDVRVLDHLIVTSLDCYSFAEIGLI